jgi:hypothetical protein
MLRTHVSYDELQRKRKRRKKEGRGRKEEEGGKITIPFQ